MVQFFVKLSESTVELWLSLFLCLSALQSPIEYQRRESKSNSLGRCMRPPLSAASALRPHSSASIDRHKLPSLHSHNTSLPTLYLPSHGQGLGPSETYSLRDVGFLTVSFSALHTAIQQQLAARNTAFLFMRHLGCKWYCVHAIQCQWVTYLLFAFAAHCGPAMPCWLPHCFSITCPTGLHWSAKLSSCVKWAVHTQHTKCTGSVYACI